MSDVSERAKSYVGGLVTLDGRPGVCLDVRSSGSTIIDNETGEQWPGVQFFVAFAEGVERWSVTFPDKEANDG